MEIVIGVPLIMALLTFAFWFLVYLFAFNWLRKQWRKLTSKSPAVATQKTPGPHRPIIGADPVAMAKPVAARVVSQPMGRLDAPVPRANVKTSTPVLKERAFALVRALPKIGRRAAVPAEAPAAQPSLYHVAKDGEDLGAMSISAIKKMLATGGLTSQDFYLNPSANEWVPLDRLPELV